MPIKKMSNICINALLDEGFTQSQIARTCSVSRQAVNQRVHYNYVAVEEGRRKRKRIELAAVALFKEGLSARMIGKILNRHWVTIYRYVKKHTHEEV